MSGNNYMKGKADPFADGGETPPTLAEVDAIVYGGGVGNINIPKTDKRTAMPIDIMSIAPDLAQPRRVVPMDIRGSWRGEPDGAGVVLGAWWDEARRLTGREINVKELIKQIGEGVEDERTIHPIADEFIALVALAGSIYRDGLLNPITIIREKNGYVIEGGERRWWAYQLLYVWMDETKWKSIPAYVVDGKEAVWRQAAENGVRRPLNAISTARQLALLIMDMWQGRDSTQFNGYVYFDHDQEFYAQVKNGQAYPILKGMMERVLAVTGLKSRAQVAQYRALLSVPESVWDEADRENWTENYIREYMQNTRRPVGTLTTVNTSPLPSPIPQPKIGLQNAPYQSQTTPQPPVNLDDDDDDDVMMDDDNEPIIVRPFGGGGITSHDGGMGHPHDIAPSALDDEQLMDYQSLLKSFMMLMRDEEASDMGILTRAHIRAWRDEYTLDEILQTLASWLLAIDGKMRVIYAQAEDFNRMVYDIASKMKGVGDGE